MARIAVLAHAHHAIREPYAGGMEMHTGLLCQQLTTMGHEVVLFGKDGSDANVHELVAVQPADSVYVRYPEGSWDYRRQASRIHHRYRRALEIVDAGEFDYVINNSLNDAPLLWNNRMPMLSVFHTPIFQRLHEPAREAARMARRAFVTVSEANATNWRPYVPQIEVIQNGIDLNKWTPQATPTDELRWSARITPEKGLHLAIDAAKLLGRTLRFAGPITDSQYFDQAIRPRLSPTAIYAGHLSHSELPRFISEGAVALATPMWEEPFGLSVAEAMACGTPVAALPRGAMGEVVTADTGAIATDSTVEALVAAIRLAETKSRTDCVSHAAANFSVKTMVRKYLEKLESLTGGVSAAERSSIVA